MNTCYLCLNPTYSDFYYNGIAINITACDTITNEAVELCQHCIVQCIKKTDKPPQQISSPTENQLPQELSDILVSHQHRSLYDDRLYQEDELQTISAYSKVIKQGIKTLDYAAKLAQENPLYLLVWNTVTGEFRAMDHIALQKDMNRDCSLVTVYHHDLLVRVDNTDPYYCSGLRFLHEYALANIKTIWCDHLNNTKIDILDPEA